MKTSTNTLTGLALNYAVAKAEKHQSRCEWMLEQKGHRAWQSYEQAWGNPIPDYCGDWSAAGPIIEREGISWHCGNKSSWHAYAYGSADNFNGTTPLIAAMRTYVTSKLGDTVEVPEELL